jgi:signal transduction histidine kinase
LPVIRRPSIGTVLLLMNLAILILPLSGLWVLRLYESALIRQTESELIAQGAIVAAAYRSGWHANGGQLGPDSPTVDSRWTHQPGYDDPWLPRFAGLDLAVATVLPPPPDPAPTSVAMDEAARQAGVPLSPLLREAQRVTLAGIRVLDRHGLVVASTGESIGLSLFDQEEVARALLGEPVSVLRQRGKGPAPSTIAAIDRGSLVRVFTAMPVLDDDRVIGVVLLARTPTTITQALYDKRWHLAGLAVLLLGVVATFAVLGSLAIGRPLRAVTAQAKRTAEGERGAMTPVAYPVVREVAELSAALTRMAATLEQRADYIRDFATHVSHEFKTPLTTIVGTVELLRDHLDEMSAEERERFLGNLDAEAGRLARLVSRLLDLARADVMHGGDGEVVRPATLLPRLVGRYAASGMAIDVQAMTDSQVAMGEDVLETILVNLLDNARQHGGPGVRVAVSLRHDEDKIVLTVADDGPGISLANAPRVFAPFFTTARKTGGTGLGLSIVNSLVTAHGGVFRLVPSDSGAVFRIDLPWKEPPQA